LNGCDRAAAPGLGPGPAPGPAPGPGLRIVPWGRERLPSGDDRSRHQHLHPYAIVVIAGQFDQVGYAGRLRVSAGDLLVQPTLDAHANQMPRTRGAEILRLPWPDVDDLGGALRLDDVDAIVRAAERDLPAAVALARGQAAVAGPPRRRLLDLPDLLAAELASGGVSDLARWAEHRGVARETASRAFTAAFGVPARRFRAELRARTAWLQIVRTRDGLAAIAAAAGFADQAHMTRHVRALTGASPARWRRDPRVLELCRVRSPRTAPTDRR
jgi:AraC-like DNA-binding protein